MPTLNLGRVRFNWRDQYDPLIGYQEYDCVEDDGQSYVNISPVTGTGPNDTGGGAYWGSMLIRSADYNQARQDAIDAAEAADTSATNASNSATTAGGSATNANNFATKADQWANEAENVEVEPAKYSAYHWMKKAEAFGNPNQFNITADQTSDTRTTAEWAAQTLTNQQDVTSAKETADSAVQSGVVEIDVSGGVNHTLTADEAITQVIRVFGALTASIALIVPNNLRRYTIINDTTGGFTVTARTAAGTGIVLSGGLQTVRCDGINVVSDVYDFTETPNVAGSPLAKSTDVAKLTGGEDANFTAMPQVGGAPVVESGSNSDGRWTKYADGTLIVVSAVELAHADIWTFPVSFANSEYSVQGSVVTALENARTVTIGLNNSSSVRIHVYASGGGAANGNGYFSAIGVWK